MKKTLAIDYGTKRIGTAISRGTLSEPFKVIANSASQDSVITKQALDELYDLIVTEEIDHIVIGISENETAEKTKLFFLQLQKHLHAKDKNSIHQALSMELFDETMSSYEVRQRLQQRGIKQKVRSGPIDHFAAAVILEEWMEVKD